MDKEDLKLAMDMISFMEKYANVKFMICKILDNYEIRVEIIDINDTIIIEKRQIE